MVSSSQFFFIFCMVISVVIQLYGMIATKKGGNMGEINESFHGLETTIKWISWVAGPMAILWLAFSATGLIRWFAIVSLIIFVVTLLFKFTYKHSFSEHVINGVTILGLLLSFYNVE